MPKEQRKVHQFLQPHHLDLSDIQAVDNRIYNELRLFRLHTLLPQTDFEACFCFVIKFGMILQKTL